MSALTSDKPPGASDTGLSRRDRFRGILIGTAVGDAVGLPAEGISRRRSRKLFARPWRHSLVLGRGFVSDDTDHAVFACQSLIAHPDSVEAFARRLARCLRWWLAALPPGIGLATVRAIGRLWLGVRPSRSGVHSAGNGPAMRAAPIGACFADDPAALERYLGASTRITHTDPRALTGARAIAAVAAWCVRARLDARPESSEFVELLRSASRDRDDPEWAELVDQIASACHAESSVEALADSLGLARGVSGYIYHTVPVVAYAWYRHFGDFRATVTAVLDCGGDADTTGAIAGALAGAAVGERGIPREWIDGIIDWPRGMRTIVQIADEVASSCEHSRAGRPVTYFWPAVPLRNLCLLAIVLAHGFRRMLPPY